MYLHEAIQKGNRVRIRRKIWPDDEYLLYKNDGVGNFYEKGVVRLSKLSTNDILANDWEELLPKNPFDEWFSKACKDIQNLGFLEADVNELKQFFLQAFELGRINQIDLVKIMRGEPGNKDVAS